MKSYGIIEVLVYGLLVTPVEMSLWKVLTAKGLSCTTPEEKHMITERTDAQIETIYGRY